MKVFFIEEKERKSFIDMFNMISIKENKILIVENLERQKTKRMEKLVDRIYMKLRRVENSKLIIERKLKNEKFINLLVNKNVKLIQGKKLNKILLDDYIEKIIKDIKLKENIKYGKANEDIRLKENIEDEKTNGDNNLKEEKIKISIVINYEDEWAIELIKKLAERYKNVNIVTNNVERFGYLEKKLYDNYGIIITLTNNKKYGLKKSNIIVNIDESNEMLNKYNIYENSIIISLNKKIKIKKKRFNGKIIESYEVKLKKDTKIYQDLMKDKYKKYDLKDLIEGYIEEYPDEIKNIVIK